MSADAHTRRSVLVDRRFQLKYVVGLAAGGALLCACFGGTLWLTLHEAHLGPGAEMAQLLEGTETTVLLLTGAMVVLMTVVLALTALLVTQRVAGPARLMRMQLRAMGEGTYPRWRSLRAHDELRDLFAEFHATVDALRRREHEEVTALEAALGASAAAEQRAILEALAARKRARLGEAGRGA